MQKVAIPLLKRSEDHLLTKFLFMILSLSGHLCSAIPAACSAISSGVSHHSATLHKVVNHQKCSRVVKSKMHLDLAVSGETRRIVGSGVVRDTWMLFYFLPGLSLLQKQQSNLYSFAFPIAAFQIGLAWLLLFKLFFSFLTSSYLTLQGVCILSCS